MAVAALSLIPRLWVALHHPLSYNGAWHLFIARNFSREYANLAHPPLFLLLLRACDAVSHTLLSFRFVPLLAGVGSVYLVGRVLLKLGTLPVVAMLGALATALASSAILLSNLVESYSICVLFLLGSLVFYLDLVPADRLPPVRSRIAFASLACLALLSHYFAGLFLIGCVLAPLGCAAMLPGYRRALRGMIPRRWRADLLTLVPPALMGLLLYKVLARPFLSHGTGSIPLATAFRGFIFEPGTEPVTSFLVRNLRNAFNLFAPVALPRARYALPPLILFFAAVLWPAAEKRPELPSANRLLPSLFLLLLLLIGMALGVLGAYPFGGRMRQQFLLFVFALLAAFVALDRLVRAVRASAQLALVALCLGAIGANLVLNRDQLVEPEVDTLSAKVGIFQQNLPEGGRIHLDQFNLVGLFMDFYGWDCRFAGRDSAKPWVEQYELSRSGHRLSVVAHRNWWIMDFKNPNLYADLRTSFQKGADLCEAVFCVNRNLSGKPPFQELAEKDRQSLRTRILAMASVQGLEARQTRIEDYVYAEFCPARTTRE